MKTSKPRKKQGDKKMIHTGCGGEVLVNPSATPRCRKCGAYVKVTDCHGTA